eukprot:symbB.v1.2.017071.t1/scaffold1283.1/size126978/10
MICLPPQDIEGILREELAAHPTYQLVFCGHSMGGALGAMCVAILRAKATIPETCSAYTWAKSCRAFGIGTPAVLSRNLGESLAQQKAVYTTVNAQDWSPRASLSNATELLDDLCELSMARTVARLVSGNSYGRGAATAVEPEVEQLPPGVILQIVPGKETKLLKAVGIDYRHDFPAWPDVAAHIPLAYIEGLAKGLRRYVSSDPSRSYCQPAASQALGRVMDATAVCDKAKLPNYPDQARLVVTEQLKHLGSSSSLEEVRSSSRSRSPKKAKGETGTPKETKAKSTPEIEQAKLEALEKLRKLQSVEPKEARAKEWRALLRDWHPDKNPDKVEVAKEVFQFLQKGKTIINV